MARKTYVRGHTRRKPKGGRTQVNEYLRTIKGVRKRKGITLRPKKAANVSEFLKRHGYTRYSSEWGTIMLSPGHYIGVGHPNTMRIFLYQSLMKRGLRPKCRKYRLYGFYPVKYDGPLLVFRSGKSRILINPVLFKEALKVTGTNIEFYGYLSDTPLIIQAKGRPSAMIAPVVIDNFNWKDVEPLK